MTSRTSIVIFDRPHERQLMDSWPHHGHLQNDVHNVFFANILQLAMATSNFAKSLQTFPTYIFFANKGYIEATFYFCARNKLRQAGVSEVLILWIYGFLSKRRQRVVIGSDASDWEENDTGVPQGTVLGPILFLVFINDCPLGPEHSFSHDDLSLESESGGNAPANDDSSLFMDDISLWATGTPSEQIQSLNQRLERIYEWSNTWGIDFSVRKTRYVAFGVTRDLPIDQRVMFGDSMVKLENSYKYLGVIFERSLRFYFFCEYLFVAAASPHAWKFP